MKCTNCGIDLPEGTLFCSKCGTKVFRDEGVKKISLKCNSCGGTMDVDEGSSVLQCPFCGSKEMLVENDAVKIEQIKADAYKDIEREKIKAAEEQLKKADEKERAESFKNGKISKLLILGVIISICLAIIFFSLSYIVAGILAVVQAVCFAIAWCFGMQIIKEKIHFLHILIAIVGLLLLIPMLRSCASDNSKKRYQQQAQRQAEAERSIEEYEQEQQRKKEEAATATQPITETIQSEITTIQPEQTTDTANTEMSEYETTDKVETIISTEETDSDSIDQSETEIKEAVKNGDYSLVTPEFKALMDDYEAFYDDYIAFMKKYSSGEGDMLSMLTEYTEMLTKMGEWSEKIEKIDESKLSPADDAYYLLVVLRVSQKMIMY